MSDQTDIYNSAVRMLSMREHGTKELHDKLVAKGFIATTVDEVICQLLEQRLVCDERYVEMVFRSALHKGHGPNRVTQSLYQKGIERYLIENHLETTEVDWWALAVEVKQKKFGSNRAEDWQQKQKQQRFLHNRGFTLDQINYAINAEDQSDT
ncbi:regulatory protein RecX [Alteromonas sp. ASW11-36]|uniref:Regulatory protein RecX n=1 Tax=Alteromonas arenosi TaxID=3055817 RepID=A0ABT7SV72_9ALTE|nr:regulatory protein RecX [Alteromonas sp. ASW11-36]MDM7860094.1 regulatory protein RecX [Alteromonas sp. ASW11-36]